MKKIYIWEPNMALIWKDNLYLNEEGIIEVESGTWQEQLCLDYKLLDLEYLNEKYLSPYLDLNVKKKWKTKTENPSP